MTDAEPRRDLMPHSSAHEEDDQESARTGRVLRYQHVYDLVVELIRDRNLQPGDQLPSTTELAEMAGVSIISVRRALDELTRRGRIVRHQGVGTFVASPRIVSEPSRPGGLLQTLRGLGDDVELKTELVRMIVGLPSEQQAAALGIEPGAPVWEVARLRRLGSKPKVFETAVLPLALIPSLDEAHLASGGSLYALLTERHGFTDDVVEQAFEVDEPTPAERQHLQLSAADDVVRIRGVSLNAEGVAFDSFQQTYPAKDFIFYVSGTSRQRLIEPSRETAWDVRPLGQSAAAVIDADDAGQG